MAGLLSIPSGSRAFLTKEAYSNNGSISINLGKTKGIIYVKSAALNGDKIKCFMAKTSAVEVVGSALDSIFENYVTATITNGDLVVTAKTTSGTGFVNLTVSYFG